MTYNDWQSRLVVRSDRNVFDFPHYEKSVDDSSKDDVLVVEEITFSAGDEELTAVCVFAAVCHRQKSCGIMFQSEIFIGKCIAVVDVDDSCSVIVHEISSLDHEVLDNSVEAWAFVSAMKQLEVWRRGNGESDLTLTEPPLVCILLKTIVHS